MRYCIVLFIGQILIGQTTNQITFSEHISPIIYNKCTECHRSGEAGKMSLSNYQEISAEADMIKFVTQSGYMPPWPPDPNYTPHNLLDQRFLTEEEKQLIADWVDGGWPEGNPDLEAEMPIFPTGSAIGDPDYVFEMEEEYFIEGNNYDDYRVFVFPTGFTDTTYIKAIEFRPDNREAVHHAIMMIDVTGTAAALDAQSPNILGYEAFGGFSLDGVSPNDYVFLGGYAPGMNPIVWNGELGMKIPPGADLLCQIHYAPSSIDEWDRSSINIFTKPASEVEREVQMKMWLRLDIDIPAETETEVEACLNFSTTEVSGMFEKMGFSEDFYGPGPITLFDVVPTSYSGEQQCELPEDWSLLGILPHSHRMGKSWEVYAETPDGEILPIIKIPNWDFDWQGFYYPEYMQHIPAGSRIEAIATYDNTSESDMEWGELTTDEMFFCPIYYVPYKEGDENIYLGIDNQTIVVENETAQLNLFPNPATDQINIKLNFESLLNLNTQLYDSQGRLLEVIFDENFQSEGNSIKLDITNLSSGKYFIKIQSQKEVAIGGFVKE